MRRYISVEVDVEISDVLEEMDDDDLKLYGLRRFVSTKTTGGEFAKGFGRETPVQEAIRTACLRGDLPGFIEATRQMLDEEGIFLRTDRLLPAVREVAHG